MTHWWARSIVDPGKLPLLVCLGAFVLTYLLTRAVTRRIRSGKGRLRDTMTGDGLHVHHAVPGLGLLMSGAVMALVPLDPGLILVAAALIGSGASLVLDEFADILHLQDVYWRHEGRTSAHVVGLAVACLLALLVGLNPLGVDVVDNTELALRWSGSLVVTITTVTVIACVAKGKYRTAIIGTFVPFVAVVGAVRLARPGSWWAARYPRPRQARAADRARRFDDRYLRRVHLVADRIIGRPEPAEDDEP